MVAGFIPRKITGRGEIFALCIYAVLATQAFGILMNLQLWPWLIGIDSQLSYVPSDSVGSNIQRFFIFHLATSLAWDIPRAVLTVALILATAKPILITLKRAEAKLNLKISEHAKQQKAA